MMTTPTAAARKVRYHMGGTGPGPFTTKVIVTGTAAARTVTFPWEGLA
jgi:hypothetical protein